MKLNPSAFIRTWICIASLLSPFTLIQAAESPLVIPFQGQVTNQQNAPVATGQYSLIFNLYDVAVGGQPLWTERHSKVGVTNGMVNVFLGSITSMAAVDFSQTRYLGITVDVDDKPTTADPEMVPRQMIIPAFYTKQAERTRKMDVLDGSGQPVSGQSYGWTSVFSDGNPGTGTIPGSKLTNGSVTVSKVETSLATAFVPTGSVIAFSGTLPPAGWALCNGSSQLRTDPQYASLFGVISVTFG